MGCGTGQAVRDIQNKEWQDLSGWNGITLKELLFRLTEQTGCEVRVYTVATTRLDKESKVFRHLGSGPNLEGSLATLCTCKHSMRQNHSSADWKGLWIIGLTSRAANKGFSGEHYLLYMMKIDQAFESHKELHEYLKKYNGKSLKIKSAVRNPLGDVFEPVDICTNYIDPKMYKTPHKKHSHGYDGNTQWHDDIVYKNRSSPLLLGDIKNTFVWPKPMIKFKPNRGSGNMKLTLGEDLFNLLETSG